jgi:excisionase family DNA binding protein
MAKIGERDRGARMTSVPEAGEAARPLKSGKLEPAASEANAVVYYTVAALADRWAITERQVHRFIASGVLIATRFGRAVRISAAEVARFEASRTGVK